MTFHVRFTPDALPVSLRGVIVCTKETLSVMQEVRNRTSGASNGKKNPSSSRYSGSMVPGSSPQRQHGLLGVCSVPMIQFYRQDQRVCITRGCTYVFDTAAQQSQFEELRGMPWEKSNPSNWTSLLFQMEHPGEADALVEVLLQGFAEEIFIPPPMPDNITDIMRSRSNSRHWGKSTSWPADEEDSRMARAGGEHHREVAFRKSQFPLPNPPLPHDAEEEWIQPVNRSDMHRSSPPIRKTRPTQGTASSAAPPLPSTGPAHPPRSPRPRTRGSEGTPAMQKTHEGHLSHRSRHRRTSSGTSTVLVEVTTMTTPRGSHRRHTSTHHALYPTSPQSPQPRTPPPLPSPTRVPPAPPPIPPALSSPLTKRKRKAHPKASPTTSIHKKTPEARPPHACARHSPEHYVSLSSSPRRHSRKKQSSRHASKPASPAVLPRSTSVHEEVNHLLQRFMRFEHHRQHMLVQLHRELVRKAFQTAAHSVEQKRMQQALADAAAEAEKQKSKERRKASASRNRLRREVQEAKAREERAASTERKLQEAHRLYEEVQKEREALQQEKEHLKRAKKQHAESPRSAKREHSSRHKIHPHSSDRLARVSSSSSASSPHGAAAVSPRRDTTNSLHPVPLSSASSHGLPPMKILLFRRLLVGEHWKQAFFPACEEDVRHSAVVDIAMAAKLPRALIELQRVEPVGRMRRHGTSMDGQASRRRSESDHFGSGDKGGRGGGASRRKSTSWSISEHRSPSRHRRYSSHPRSGGGRTPSWEREGLLQSSLHARDGFYNEVMEVEDLMAEEEAHDIASMREGEIHGVRGLLIISKIRFVPSEVLTTDALRHRLRMCGFPILRNMYAHRAAFGLFQGLDDDTARVMRPRSRSHSRNGWDAASCHRKSSLSRRSSPVRCGHSSRSRDADASLSPRSSHHHAFGNGRLSLSTSGMLRGYGGREEHQRCRDDGSGRPSPTRGNARHLAPGGPGGSFTAAAGYADGGGPSAWAGPIPSHPAGRLTSSCASPPPPPPPPPPSIPNPYTTFPSTTPFSGSSGVEGASCRTGGAGGLFSPYAREEGQEIMDPNAFPLGSREKSLPWSYAPVTTAGGAAHGRGMVLSLEGMSSTERVDRAVMDVAEARQRHIIMTAHRHRLALLDLDNQEKTARLQMWMEQEPMERCSIQVQALPLKRFPYAVRSILLGESVHRDQVKTAENQARQWLERQRNPFLAKGVAKAKEALRKEEAAERLTLELESLSKLLDIITYDQRQRRWWGNRAMQTSNRTHEMIFSMLSQLIEVEREERLDLVRHEARLRSVMQQHLYEEEEAVYAQRLQMVPMAELTGIGPPSHPGTESGVEHRAPSSRGKFSENFVGETHSNPSLEVTTHSVRRRRFQSQKHVKPFHYLTFSPEDMDFKPNAESATDGILGCTINRNLEVVEISRPLLKKDGDEDGMEFQTGDMILDASGQALHSLSHFREVLSHRIMLIQEEAKMEFPDLPEEEWTTNPALQKYIEVLCEHHNFLIQVLRGCDIVQLIVKS